MRVIRERAKVTTAGPGVEGFDAEVTVEDENAKEYYIHANAYEGLHYTVAEKSYFEWMTNLSNEDPGEIDYLEEYQDIKDTKNSSFYKYIKMADRMLNDLTS